MDDHAPLIERAFTVSPCERCYELEEIEGEIPSFIRGTFYLNGPARFGRGAFRYRHWLDGDGMVCALRFEHGRVLFTNRYVRTAKFVAEEEVGCPIFRTFGTSFESDRLKRGIALESPANVSVYPFGGTLLAFGEQGLPWELDPATLETRGPFTFGGRLNDATPFAAHAKIDPVTGEMFNFGVAFSPADPCLNLYRFDCRANPVYRKRTRLDCPRSVHDFGLSGKYAVFYLSPYVLDLAGIMRNGGNVMSSLRWEPERGSRLLVLSRETGDAIASIPIGCRYCLHLINCFDAGGRLTVDVVEFERPIYDQYQEVPDLFTDVPAGQPVRLVVDVETRELIDRREIDYTLAPDFPSIDARHAARSYRRFWMLGISATGRPGRKFFDQLVHANWEDPKQCDVYQAPPGSYLAGEPVLIGDPGDEEAGALICQIFDARRGISYFAIFDSCHVSRGPVALLRLSSPVHLGFHASFRPD